MKNSIKWLGIIAFVTIIGFSMTACSKASPDTDFRYVPSDDSQGMVITGYNGENFNVVIPSKIQKLPVVQVGGFSGRNIISVVIPASAKVITRFAFKDCENLTSIVIPANVKEIESVAFQGCSNLASVTFKGKNVIIGQEAFRNCKNLDKLIFADGAIKPLEYTGALGPREMLGRIVFDTEHYFYNPGRKGRTWGMNGDDYVFYFHSGTSAFYGCDKLSAETISKLKTIGFLSPEEMLELEEKARRGDLDGNWSGSNSTSQNNQSTSKPYYATTNLRVRSEPDTSKDNQIGRIPEGDSVELLEVGRTETMDGVTAPWYRVKAADGTTGWVFSGYLSDTEISRSGDFEMNGTVLVKYNGNAANVTIPAGVTAIGQSAFQECTGLTSVAIPAGVTSIGGHAFSECSNLISVTISASVTIIERYAFSWCTSLTNVTIPTSVKSIGENAFFDTAWLNSQPDGLVYAGKVLYKYKGTMPANTVINNIQADTVEIANYAFSGCTGLTNISIPAGVTTIGWSAFDGCTGLTSIAIPSSVTSIKESAFRGCTSLTNVTIPASVKTIGSSAFDGCPLPPAVRNDIIKRFGEYPFLEWSPQ